MEKVELKTFKLEKYDSNNKKHIENAKLFEIDSDYDTYMEPFWSLENSVKYSNKQGRYSAVYFAYIGDTLIGMIGTIWVYDFPELVVSILPSKRGNHYSRTLVKEYVDYIFKTYKDYMSIYAHIHDENIHSIENIIASGFEEYGQMLYVKKRYHL